MNNSGKIQGFKVFLTIPSGNVRIKLRREFGFLMNSLFPREGGAVKHFFQTRLAIQFPNYQCCCIHGIKALAAKTSLAETRGFEPPNQFLGYLISSEAHSTGLCDVSEWRQFTGSRDFLNQYFKRE